MDDLGFIDRFTDTFSRYIDSGFGLLTSEVAFLTSVLIALDLTLAGLRWAGGTDSDVLAALIRKVLYVGAFALLLNNWAFLSDVIFQSFAGLGLQATGNGLTPDKLLRPGFIAATGFDAAQPLAAAVLELPGYTKLLSSFFMAMILCFSWFFVVVAFFILAVQLLITIIEFKLTSLAGFVLVPFALWNKSAFLAERVLGAVISSGIKMMVLAVILAIGSTFFRDIAATLGPDPTIKQVTVLLLASLALLGLGIFGPGIATGLVSGAPQLGAGAALGTAGAALGATGAALGAVGLASKGSLGAIKAAATIGAGTKTAYGLGQGESSGLAGVSRGLGGIARAGYGVSKEQGSALFRPITEAAARGRAAAERHLGAKNDGTAANVEASGEMPAWAKRMQANQARQHSARRNEATAQAVKEGDRPGAPANPSLDEKE